MVIGFSSAHSQQGTDFLPEFPVIIPLSYFCLDSLPFIFGIPPISLFRQVRTRMLAVVSSYTNKNWYLLPGTSFSQFLCLGFIKDLFKSIITIKKEVFEIKLPKRYHVSS